MKYPLDSSDEANLILADYLEEYDDINLANEVRNSVLTPNINVWCYEYYYGSIVGSGIIGDVVGNFGGVGVRSSFSNFDVGSLSGGFGSVVGSNNSVGD